MDKTDLILPIGFFLLFVGMCFKAAEMDHNAGRTSTMEVPAPLQSQTLDTYYIGCKGTPIEVTVCYFKNQHAR